MKKIPTLFERDWEGNKSRVLDRPSPVHAILVANIDRAIPTVKYDGTAVMVRCGVLYKRFDCKKDREPPPGFEPCDEKDPVTGHWPGWVPVDTEPESKWHRLAFERAVALDDGTYEVCGPHFQGNPEKYTVDRMVPHGQNCIPGARGLTSFEDLRAFLESTEIEGIVWWLDGKPLCKIKRRDFGFRWPVKP